VQSVFNLDPPMIMGTVLFAGALVVGANWVVDLLYAWIDPRIKSGT
jgi:ABC-type dipeptide/oligopeptide/nickel transport system permease component